MPAPPPGLIQALSFDLSPMRPDEWLNANAELWNEALQLRNAYDAGAAEARKAAERDAASKASLERLRGAVGRE